MDKVIKVKLTTVQDVFNFCGICSKFKCPITAQHSTYKVNAKSSLGVLSLNLSEIINVVFEDIKGNEDFTEFNTWIIND